MAKQVQKDKRSTKHTYKSKDRVTRTPLGTGDELGCSGRVTTCSCLEDASVDDLTSKYASN